MAALSVAVVHLFSGFAVHIDRRLDGLPQGDQLAQAAVALFFVISGCVMVLSSGRLFSSAGATVHFWRRRAVRVLPPYWIATGVMAAVMLALGLAVDTGYLARSLAFVPTPRAGGRSFQLFLWPGWTLLYELIFYALFGAFVGFGRTRAVILTALAIGALVVAGALANPSGLPGFIVTRPILLLFIVGMVAGLALQRGLASPAWVRALAMVAALAAFALPQPADSQLGVGYLGWAGLPAILTFVTVMGGPLRIPFIALWEALGDASYAIYLIHVPFALVWMRIFHHGLDHPGGSLGYMASGVPLLIALSLAFYRWIERPMTMRLNVLLGGQSSRKSGPIGDLAP
ncbi:acyltransferase [Tsuneonella deserti]|uniref:Acyltransferase n=1 Tax=Tsuneonella deserti TaxID=2035528 RepID=A0ABQ1S9C4_9SPHN|nr:acyltransferase [Tsuneonella deserti]